MPKVLNAHIHGIPKDAVYIGRPSIWGNPYPLFPGRSREEVIRKYKVYLDNNPELKTKAKTELEGKDLVCFCSPLACHGDYLMQIANE